MTGTRTSVVMILLALSVPAWCDTDAISAEGTFLVVVNVSDGVNLRDAPGADCRQPNGNKIGALFDKTRVRAKHSSDSAWYEVYPEARAFSNGKIAPAFVCAEYLKPVLEVQYDVFFPDVGDGDAVLITVDSGEILIDGGLDPELLWRYLGERKRPRGALDLLVVTSPDADHWLGLQCLPERYGCRHGGIRIREFWEPGISPCSRAREFTDFKVALRRNKTTYVRTSPGESNTVVLRSVPEVLLTIVYSRSDPPRGGDCIRRSDDSTLVLLAQINQTRFLIAGDVQGLHPKQSWDTRPNFFMKDLLEAEAYRMEHCREGRDCRLLRADVLKAPDHASRGSTSKRFRDAVHPTFVIIAAQENQNIPDSTAVERYQQTAKAVLRTNENRGSRNDDILCTNRFGNGVSCIYTNTPD